MNEKEYMEKWNENSRLGRSLFINIQDNRKELEDLYASITRHEGPYEGKIYRFYHFSFKVYFLRGTIKEIVDLLQKLDPKENKEFCEFFQVIIGDAEKIGEWKQEHNKDWLKFTRPIVEAFFHAKYMLEMAVICSKYKSEPEQCVDQKWAALLELYKIR